MSIFEKYYGKAFKSFLWVINPIKKQVIETECQVHRFITYKALKLLNKYDYGREYEFFNFYLDEINSGVWWADQDFKSINHFYNPGKKRGLYGHGNALAFAKNYYDKAIKFWNKKDIEKSMFYLGASVHIIQDMTIPQHVNIRLLDSHRRYENFVKMTYDVVAEYVTYKKPIMFKDLESYVIFNSKMALKIYDDSRDMKNEEERFHHVTRCILPIAQRTTAGCFLMFLEDVDFKTGLN